jgi:hypothetical protein
MKKIIFIIVLVSSIFSITANASLEEILGNGEIGSSCQSDYECESFCCNSSIGSCTPHAPKELPPVFCNKTNGQSCITSEFCNVTSVMSCKIVKSGLKADGSLKCELRCPSIKVHGDCVDKICQPPVQLPVPHFDPDDCSQAIDP